jgi:hypothetical protein
VTHAVTRSLQLLAIGVRRQQVLIDTLSHCSHHSPHTIYTPIQMLSHIMDGSDKGPERRAKVCLASPLDTPQPPPLTSASAIALAGVIKDVLKRVEQSAAINQKKNEGAKASMMLFR